jgi:hypothetical protein
VKMFVFFVDGVLPPTIRPKSFSVPDLPP